MNSYHLGRGVWIASGSSIVTEIAAESGLDWILLDLEHGCLSESAILNSLMACKGTSAKPVVRVGKTDPVLIARVLDWGAIGIMLPHVSSKEDAVACLNAMNYPPFGKRGYTSSARQFNYGQKTPVAPSSHPRPIFMAQIEDYEGLLNLDAIAATPGVDILFVGPSDLQLDLTAHSHPIDFDEALKSVAEAAHRHKKQAGILVKKMDDISDLQERGFTCLAMGSDIGALRKGFKEMLDA